MKRHRSDPIPIEYLLLAHDGKLAILQTWEALKCAVLQPEYIAALQKRIAILKRRINHRKPDKAESLRNREHPRKDLTTEPQPPITPPCIAPDQSPSAA